MKDRFFIITLWMVGAEGEETYTLITVKTEKGCHFAHTEIEKIVAETFPFVEFFTIMWFKEVSKKELCDFQGEEYIEPPKKKKDPDKDFIFNWKLDSGERGCISCGDTFITNKEIEDTHKGYCCMNCMLDDML